MRILMAPKWFNSHGLKMLGVSGPTLLTVSQEMMVSVTSNIATLKIIKSLDGVTYKVDWHITHGPGEFAQGQIHLEEAKFNAAFGLGVGMIPSEFALKHGAEVGIPGEFIRERRFLNIPMPGTGMDGDPNISVFVSDEIKEAVLELIDCRR